MARAATSPRSVVRPKPFTVDHFRLYARQLVLDTGQKWEPEDWQLDVVGDLFGDANEIWLIVPQGNGKTTLMGGVALYHSDFTPSPWVPIAASSAKQARILYTKAEEFVQRTPQLQRRFKPQPGYLRILSLANGGWGIQVYAADKDTGEGIIPTLCLVDEPHVQKDLGLYRTWRGKLRKRQGKIAAISTAGEPGTDFEETRDKIRIGAAEREQIGRCRFRYVSRNGRLVMHEFRVPKAELVRDLDVVKEANPLSAVTRAELQDLLESDTLDWGEDWLRKTCNIPSRSSQAAITDQEWDDAQTKKRIPKGESVDVGLDVAWKYDTTALVPLWLRDQHFRLFGDPRILTPPRDGSMLSSREIKDAFEEIHDRNPIGRVVMDREKGETIAEWLEEELGVEVVERGRTNEPASFDYESFMEGLREGWIKHTGHAGFRRHAMNAVVRHLPGDRKRFDRPMQSRRSPREQDRRVIDCLDAASMVHSNAMADVGTPVPFVEVVA